LCVIVFRIHFFFFYPRAICIILQHIIYYVPYTHTHTYIYNSMCSMYSPSSSSIVEMHIIILDTDMLYVRMCEMLHADGIRDPYHQIKICNNGKKIWYNMTNLKLFLSIPAMHRYVILTNVIMNRRRYHVIK